MSQKYIVVNPDGLNVRSQMSTLNALNIKRKMSNGEGFTVYQTYVQKGNQVWGRVSDNPGNVQQEFVCLSIANREYARLEAPTAPLPLAGFMRLPRRKVSVRLAQSRIDTFPNTLHHFP